MKAAGYLLIAVGFGWGSLVAVQTPDNSVNWAGFLPALVLAAIGVLMARVASSRVALGVDLLKTDHRHLREAIDRIVLNLAQIEAAQAELHPGDLHARIDAGDGMTWAGSRMLARRSLTSTACGLTPRS